MNIPQAGAPSMAAVLRDLRHMNAEMASWRRHLHQHPEMAFKEKQTAAFVADKLKLWGYEVDTGLAGTGAVATRPAAAGPAIGLRADMDALPIDEINNFAHCSRHPGVMHACGHDGHTTMLLGAAHFMAKLDQLPGTVRFIFQPAEENEGGAEVMIREGLFQRHPVDAIFGMHNYPGLPVGSLAVRPGPLTAGFDTFEILVTGTGGHSSKPAQHGEAITAAAALVGLLQNIVAREVDPLASAVLAVTQINGGSAWNVIPDTVTLRGSTRHFLSSVQKQIEDRMSDVCAGVALAYGVKVNLDYRRRYPALTNSKRESQWALEAARAVVGETQVITEFAQEMGSEDFAFMLRHKPGCYVLIGNGDGDARSGLHTPHYDFNDEALAIGAAFWVSLCHFALGALADPGCNES